MKKNQVYGLDDVEVKDHVYDSSTVTKTSTGHSISGGIKMKKYGLGRAQKEKDTKKLPKQSSSKSKRKQEEIGAASLNGDGHINEEANSTISKPTAGNMKYENSAIKDEDGNEGGYDYVNEKPNSKGKGGKERRQGKTPKNGGQSSKGPGENTSQQNTKGLYYNG